MSRGRGRGRGRGKPFEALGLAPGESVPPPTLQPPPLFPALDRKPLELKSSEVENYHVIIKKDLKQYMLNSPFHLLRSTSNSFEIVRYSDKCRRNGRGNGGIGWELDWDYFPKELKIVRQKSKKIKRNDKKRKSPVTGLDKGKETCSNVKDPGSDEELHPPKSKRVRFDQDVGTLENKLASLERAEQLSAEGDQSAEPEEEDAEEVYDEEEEEEGTDYNLTYFDNGEDDVVEDDALEEGPVY